MSAMTRHTHEPDAHMAPRLLADHVALDLINTVEQVDGVPTDRWQGNADVMDWLVATGLVAQAERPKKLPEDLLVAARALREVVRGAVHKRKHGEAVDLAALNCILAQGASHLELRRDRDGAVTVHRCHDRTGASGWLAPLAEAAAELLASGDFALIRKCESDDCALWFYDRTRSHRRRWCSMALCGNRHKVASFRKRNEAAAG
ncbi:MULTISPECIES: CGNR zinc finger domain-containing protein [Cupriavidus]|uniref:CGNR zinc finger domain-containing protein n=1 Tax=Cupriavidus sp. DF5525 TaxID=3160989 RepID=UPI0003B0531E|nr:hypothetical protein N234_32105 [Ralstonia pickettii DTP0602]